MNPWRLLLRTTAAVLAALLILTASSPGKDRQEGTGSGKEDAKESSHENLKQNGKGGGGDAVAITVTAAGDCTLGTYPEVAKGRSFLDVFKAQGGNYGYFFANADEFFKKDDLSVVNLEGTLTDAAVPAVKLWRFKGPPAFTRILTEAGIEAVNLANNHIYDYKEKGFSDTKNHLKAAGIRYFGMGAIAYLTVKGTKVAMIGIDLLDTASGADKQILRSIEDARKGGAALIIVSFHWGIEYENQPTVEQQRLGRLAVDAGASLVLGHHPHILQGIERYKERYIVYSLGNFVFGGNDYLADKKHQDTDTMLFRQTFTLDGKETSYGEAAVVPYRISGDKTYNDYRPVRYTGKEAERVVKKVLELSKALKYGVRAVTAL